MLTLIGQDTLRAQLKRSLQMGRLAHATLIAGPAGVGKTKLAVDLAQALNCEASDVEPCGVCRQCTRIAGAKHADVRIIGEPGRAIGIDEMRELQHAAALVPFEGRNRVFIIGGAERMTGEAANCLLKTLEEPPSNVYLILLTSHLSSLLPTVRSRCRLLEIRPTSAKLIEEMLANERGVEREQASTISRLAEGRIGWAVEAAATPSVLDARREQLDSIVELAGLDYSDRLVRASEIADRYSKDKDDVVEWLCLLRQWWRDVLLHKSGRGDIAVNVDRLETLERFAGACSVNEAGAAVRDANATVEHLGKNANARLALDVLMLRLPQVPTTEPRNAATSRGG